MSQHPQSTATVLEALQALYHDPNPEAKKKANDWLEEFQHSVSLWRDLTGDNGASWPAFVIVIWAASCRAPRRGATVSTAIAQTRILDAISPHPP